MITERSRAISIEICGEIMANVSHGKAIGPSPQLGIECQKDLIAGEIDERKS